MRSSSRGCAMVAIGRVSLRPGRSRMIDLLQVDHGGVGVQLFEDMVCAAILDLLCNGPLRIGGITERDGARRAGLCARYRELVRRELASLRLGPRLRLADALDAEGALLHDTLAADGDVRVELPVERLRERVLLAILFAVPEPVEVANLVRAVVAAVTRAHAAVVDLDVQAIRRMIRGIHRADRLTGCIAAVLAKHRCKARIEIFGELA